MTLDLSILSADGRVVAQARGDDDVCLVHEPAYRPGDVICLATDRADADLVVQIDDGMAPAPVFCPGGRFTLPVPFDAHRVPYSPRAFAGTLHRLTARVARAGELAGRRNLCFNPYDHPDNTTLFPHATATVVTEGKPEFAARNAIDGEIANHGHGPWPFTAWGINRDPDASLTIDFGRTVEADEIALYLRADYPHDTWWREAAVVFSDGSTEVLTLRKTGGRQSCPISPRRTRWLRLERLIKADDPSPFPALTQIELWGCPT